MGVLLNYCLNLGLFQRSKSRIRRARAQNIICWIIAEYMQVLCSVPILVAGTHVFFFKLSSFFFFFLRQDFCFSPGPPGTHSVDQDGLKHKDLPAFASWVLGSNMYTITLGCFFLSFQIKSLVNISRNILRNTYGTQMTICWLPDWVFYHYVDLWDQTQVAKTCLQGVLHFKACMSSFWKHTYTHKLRIQLNNITLGKYLLGPGFKF